MRILLIHNQLWAHYKSKLFSEINLALKKSHPESEFLVVHIALHESSRSEMKDDDTYFPYDYPYKVLFKRSLDQVKFLERLIGLFRAFHTFRPTILNVTGYFDWAQILLMVYARLRGVKVVLSSESSAIDRNRTAYKENIKKWILSQADVFFCFGKSSAHYLLRLGIPRSRIAVRHAAVIDEEIIRNNFLEAKKNVQKNGNSFVYVGRLAPEKNLEMLVRAFIRVNKTAGNEGHTWGLTFVGEGPARPVLERLALEDPKITFAGGHPWYKVPEWLAQNDVLVLPSKSEPWGLVVNEAMVCSMPVIVSSKCGCVKDIVKDGQNGFTFDPENQEDLETALEYFVRNPDKIEKMGETSRLIIAPFATNEVAIEMIDCYKTL
jgi:glycosyltransferase involved in cell wall biosynthesis